MIGTRHSQSESILIERAKEGEARAFDSLIRKHRPEVTRRVRRLCRNDEDVEDIVQQVMITLYRKIHRFEGRSSLSTWLYRIATNAYLMCERRKKRDRLTFVENEPFEETFDSFPWYPYEGTDGFASVYEKELLHSVSEAMEDLPEAYREVLLLRRRDGLTLKETSRRTGVTIASVKSRQYRANRMLRGKLRLEHLNH